MRHYKLIFFFLIISSIVVGSVFFLRQQNKKTSPQPEQPLQLENSELQMQNAAPEQSDSLQTSSQVQTEVLDQQQDVQAQPSEPPQITPKAIKLLFAGDMMFDRNIRTRLQKPGLRYALMELEPLFFEHDVVIANVEGPITSNPSKSVGSQPGSTANFIFTFQPELAQILYSQNIRVVNLGNNHILNFGVNGVEQTKTNLKAANVKYFGNTHTEKNSEERTLILEMEGVKIGLVNYNQFVQLGQEKALEDLEWLLERSDLQVVYTHWGNEYQPIAKAPITTLAHTFVDKGADLIIGMHPHVIQNVEEYKGVRIYYSLGNFVFDQYFSPETQEGMVVSVTIDPSTKALTFTERKVQLRKDASTILKQE